MGQALSKHNSKLRNQQDPKPLPVCNCRGGIPACPVGGECQMTGVVYQATVTRTDTNTTETYTGLSARRFKDRLYEHRADIRDNRRNGTSLSNYIWTLKNSNTPFELKWKILSKCPPLQPPHKNLQTLLTGKVFHHFQTRRCLPQ